MSFTLGQFWPHGGAGASGVTFTACGCQVSAIILREEGYQVGPNDASWPVHSRGNAAMKGWSWPNFWASLVSFSLTIEQLDLSFFSRVYGGCMEVLLRLYGGTKSQIGVFLTLRA